MELRVRPLQEQDVEPITAAFAGIGWNKPASQYRRYLSEQELGSRDVRVAFARGAFAGYVTIVWRSDYPHFLSESIPEIQDFNVLPRFRRRRIGTCLMDEAERVVARRSPVVGIGVGVTADYGAAQRLYVLRGYVPDGRGLVAGKQPLRHSQRVTAGELVLYLTRDVGTLAKAAGPG